MSATAQSYSQLLPDSVTALAARNKALDDARTAKQAAQDEYNTNVQRHSADVAQAHANRMDDINRIIAGIV